MTTTRPAVPAPHAASGLIVRAAGEDDLDVVVALRLQLLKEEARSPLFARPRPDIALQAQALTEWQLSSKAEVILLAQDAEDVVGLLRCSISRGARLVRPLRYGFLTSAYVLPQYRRRGVLRALLQAAESWCRTRGLREVRLHCTVENADGNASWEALGYCTAEVVRRRVLGKE